MELSSNRIPIRMRRLRNSEAFRQLISETHLNASQLVSPIFLKYGVGLKEPVESMPGIFRYSIDEATKHIERLISLGIKAILLFGLPNQKDEFGSEAYNPSGLIPTAVRTIKESFPSVVVVTDVCLCEYTSHGHCGVVSNAVVDNDRTLPLLSKTALEYAMAGADVVAPSAMMDGQVKAIRSELDSNGFINTVIMSYSAKYASSFYSPFRDAVDSSPKFGDRSSYQMHFANRREALREIELDIQEGADIVMVKPALAYLDVIHEARQKFNIPIAAYSVSGEYSMIKAAAEQGWLDEKKVVMETITSMKRAGADIIITYFAETIAKWLKGDT